MQNQHDYNMTQITDRDIYLAYRKLKGEVYYDNTDLQLRYTISKWEANKFGNLNTCNGEDFQKQFIKQIWQLRNVVNSEDICANKYFKKWLDKISLTYQIKSMSKTKEYPKETNGKFISTKINNDNIQVDECNYRINAGIEIHLISILWIMFLNQYINRNQLYKYNFGNRTRTDTLPGNTLNGSTRINLSVNEPYYRNYQNWRNSALDAVEKTLNDSNESAYILSLDVKRFFYSVDLDLTLLLKKNSELGIINNNYKNDQVLTRLTEAIIAINTKYTEYCKNQKEFLNIGHLNENHTILPVGLLSSTLVANLYLTDFDNKIKKIKGVEYYGRYVDDMLFVFRGDNECYTDNPITTFVRSHFVQNSILYTDNSLNESKYVISGHEYLKIKPEKIVLEEFHKDGPKTAIEQFKKKLKERSSDSRFLLDEDELDENFENAAYSLGYSDSGFKIRDIEAFNDDRFGVSRYLRYQISLAGITQNNSGSNCNTDQNNHNKIIKFFKGARCIDYCDMWEKVATLFIMKNDSNSLIEFYKGALECINNLSCSEEINEEGIKADLKRHLDMSVAMPFSINIGQYNSKKNKNTYVSSASYYAKYFRKANMFRHYRLGLSCINYSNKLYSQNNLFNWAGKYKGKPIEIHENIHWWLSPRKVKYAELSSLLLSKIIQDDNCIDIIKNFNKLVNEKFETINYSWYVFFGGHAFQEEERIIPYINNEDKDRLIPIKVQDTNCDVNKKVGIVNHKVNKNDISDSRKGKSRLTLDRKIEFHKILDDASLKGHKADILILPELSIPYPWLDLLIYQCSRKDLAVVAGLEYIKSNNTAYNIVVTILPIKRGNYYTDCIIIPRVKNYYAPGEKEHLHNDKLKIPIINKPYYHLFHWRNIYFTVFNCYELSSIEDRALIKGKVDLVVATEFNPDTKYYSDIIGSMARDIYGYVIQVNTSQYGDSRVMQPTQQRFENMVFAKGGETPVVIIDQLNIDTLRAEQLKMVDAYNNEPYVKPQYKDKDEMPHVKASPAGYLQEDVKNRINNQ